MSMPGNMPFLDHLAALRKRIIRIVIAVMLAMGVCLLFTPQILKILLQPYGSQLKVIGPTEGISNYLRIALTAGAVLALPYVLLQLWMFIAPALLPREKGFVYILLPCAIALFLVGASFAWFVMIPSAIRFLANFSLDIFKTEWTSQNYIPFVTALLFWIGVCFEMPLVMFFLAKLRIVNARLLLRGWRYAVVLICVVAAVITPTVDPFNMMLVAAPLIGLYFLSIVLAVFAQKQKAPVPERT